MPLLSTAPLSMLAIFLTHGTAVGIGNLDAWAKDDAPLRMDFGTAVAAAVAAELAAQAEEPNATAPARCSRSKPP